MKHLRRKLWVALLAGLVGTALSADQAAGVGVTVHVGDVTKLKGQRLNKLTGMGLITGLNGTGDGDDYLPAMRPLAGALERFSNPVASIEELGGSKNVAIVMVEATLPANGVREGDRLDVQVTAFGAAKSLKGGRLLVTPLLYHEDVVKPAGEVKPVYAYASGPIQIRSEEEATTGTVKNGATCEEDVLLHFVASGRELPFTSTWIDPEQNYVTLVVDENHASWAMVHEIATAVDTELHDTADVEQVALAVDPRNVLMLMPPEQDVASWIREIERTVLLVPEAQARVIVDRNSGSIVVSGDARISPVIVSQKGLTVTVAPPGDEGEQAAPLLQAQSFVAMDPNRAGDTHLADLLEALNLLNVSVEDRIEIVTKIHRLGKLHAELIFED